jgi:hypothetical protein
MWQLNVVLSEKSYVLTFPCCKILFKMKCVSFSHMLVY